MKWQDQSTGLKGIIFPSRF